MTPTQPSRRILLLSSSVGVGHIRAAEAIELALRELSPDVYIEHHDTLKLASGMSGFYRWFYTTMAARTPHLLGHIYEAYDGPRTRVGPLERIKECLERTLLPRLRRLINSRPWDAVINTHILSAGVIAQFRRRGDVRVRQMTVTTDFQTHRFWVNEPTDHYFAATQEGADYLHALGVPPERTTVTGIPIHPVFGQPRDRNECRARHDLAGDRPVVLQLAGGIGFGPVEEFYRAILSIPMPLRIVTIAGKNESLRRRLAHVPAPDRHRVTVLGFTDKIHEIMTAADVLVGKPGGLSASEALVCNLALAITQPIPGQEACNCDYLLENGVAIKIGNAAILPGKLTALLGDPGRLAAMQANARRLARPRAAFDIARKILELTGQGPSDERVPRLCEPC